MTDSLDRKLTVTIDEKPVELFMSYGVLNKLLEIFQPGKDSPVESAMVTAEAREKVLALVLKKRGEFGLETFDPEINDISTDDVEKIFNWVVLHVSDFFIRSVEISKKAMERNQPRLDSLMPSPSGSKD